MCSAGNEAALRRGVHGDYAFGNGGYTVSPDSSGRRQESRTPFDLSAGTVRLRILARCSCPGLAREPRRRERTACVRAPKRRGGDRGGRAARVHTCEDTYVHGLRTPTDVALTRMPFPCVHDDSRASPSLSPCCGASAPRKPVTGSTESPSPSPALSGSAGPPDLTLGESHADTQCGHRPFRRPRPLGARSSGRRTGGGAPRGGDGSQILRLAERPAERPAAGRSGRHHVQERSRQQRQGHRSRCDGQEGRSRHVHRFRRGRRSHHPGVPVAGHRQFEHGHHHGRPGTGQVDGLPGRAKPRSGGVGE